MAGKILSVSIFLREELPGHSLVKIPPPQPTNFHS
jgi:hypothetical protein